jgi:hypothetical protein
MSCGVVVDRIMGTAVLVAWFVVLDHAAIGVGSGVGRTVVGLWEWCVV